MNDATTIEERIAARTDLTIAGATEVSAKTGGLEFRDYSQVMEFCKLMAISKQAVPKHCRSEPGVCLGIVTQALNWRMDPFAVANKSYMVNDRIAYEAQLIHAVIEQRAPIKGRIKGQVRGDGMTRQWLLSVVTNDGDTIDYEGPEIGKITTKNSPLWKADPDQQLWYYSVRAMCRRHFPDVILGVYEKEETQHAEGMRDVTPKEPSRMAKMVAEARGKPVDEPITGEIMDTEAKPTEADYRAMADGGAPGSEAFDAGFQAFKDGQPITDCPYDDGEAVSDWCFGWTGHEKAAAE